MDSITITTLDDNGNVVAEETEAVFTMKEGESFEDFMARIEQDEMS